MERDEHEMLVEYSEMTTFNFNSQEYQEIRKDYLECKEKVNVFENILDGIMNCLKARSAVN